MRDTNHASRDTLPSPPLTFLQTAPYIRCYDTDTVGALHLGTDRNRDRTVSDRSPHSHSHRPNGRSLFQNTDAERTSDRQSAVLAASGRPVSRPGTAPRSVGIDRANERPRCTAGL